MPPFLAIDAHRTGAPPLQGLGWRVQLGALWVAGLVALWVLAFWAWTRPRPGDRPTRPGRERSRLP